LGCVKAIVELKDEEEQLDRRLKMDLEVHPKKV
jgi:hypothetical protein